MTALDITYKYRKFISNEALDTHTHIYTHKEKS